MHKKTLLALLFSSLLIGASLVAAQSSQTESADRVQASHQRGGKLGRGPGMGLRGLPLRHLALGTTVDLSFYDGDPEAGASLLESLSFTYGEDSEAAFAEQLSAARETAAFIQVDVGEQSRSMELSSTTEQGHRLLHGLALGRGFEQEGSLTASFYDADPEAGGQLTQTLSFSYGEDSAAGFADDFANAAENASYVTLNSSPQSYTLDLSAQPERRGGHGGPRGRR